MVLCAKSVILHKLSPNNLWESSWISDKTLKTGALATSIVDRDTLNSCESIIREDEVVLFPYDFDFDKDL